MARLRGSIMVALSIFAVTEVAAEQSCRDVLTHPVLDLKTFQIDSYIWTALLAEIDSASSKDLFKSGAGNFTIKGVPVSLGYEDARRMRDKLSQKYDFEQARKHSLSVLLMSGQESIIRAWRGCMEDSSRVGVRFESLDGASGRKALLHIEYFAKFSPGPSKPLDLILANDVFVDGDTARVLSGQSCLKSGKEFKPGSSCSVQLELTSSWATLPVIFQFASSQGSFSESAYLAPRAEIAVDTKPWSDDSPSIYAYKDYAWGAWKCSEAPQDYVFVESSIKKDAHPRGASVGRPGACLLEHSLDALGKRICIRGGIMDMPAKADYYCDGKFSATLAAPRWNPPAP